MSSLFIVFARHVNSETKCIKRHCESSSVSLRNTPDRFHYICLHRLAKESVVDKKNITTTLISIEKQLNSNTNTKSISILKNQMLTLLTDFEGIKGQLTPSNRLRLRDRFLRLLTNESHELKTTIELLADYALKLSERMFLYFIFSSSFSFT